MITVLVDYKYMVHHIFATSDHMRTPTCHKPERPAAGGMAFNAAHIRETTPRWELSLLVCIDAFEVRPAVPQPGCVHEKAFWGADCGSLSEE